MNQTFRNYFGCLNNNSKIKFYYSIYTIIFAFNKLILMKKYLPLLFSLILCTFILSSGCNKKQDTTPCDSKGILCIENKLDSTIIVSIKNTHDQFPILKDYMHCSTLAGEQTYSINISATGINRDTSLIVLSCDKKLLIIQ